MHRPIADPSIAAKVYQDAMAELYNPFPLQLKNKRRKDMNERFMSDAKASRFGGIPKDKRKQEPHELPRKAVRSSCFPKSNNLNIG